MGGLIATQLRKGGYMKYLILSDTVANKEKVKARSRKRNIKQSLTSC